MLVRKDPILSLLESRRQEMSDLSKMRIQVGEKLAESQQRILEIRAKAQAAQRKQWNKTWSKDD